MELGPQILKHAQVSKQIHGPPLRLTSGEADGAFYGQLLCLSMG